MVALILALLLQSGQIVSQSPSVYNGTPVKKEVTYSVNSDNTVFITVAYTDKDGGVLDAWPGGHYLNDKEQTLYTSDRKTLDAQIIAYTDNLNKPKPAKPAVIAVEKVEVTPDK